MLRWPDYLADPPSDTTSGDVNQLTLLRLKSTRGVASDVKVEAPSFAVTSTLSEIAGLGSTTTGEYSTRRGHWNQNAVVSTFRSSAT